MPLIYVFTTINSMAKLSPSLMGSHRVSVPVKRTWKNLLDRNIWVDSHIFKGVCLRGMEDIIRLERIFRGRFKWMYFKMHICMTSVFQLKPFKAIRPHTITLHTSHVSLKKQLFLPLCLPSLYPPTLLSLARLLHLLSLPLWSQSSVDTSQTQCHVMLEWHCKKHLSLNTDKYTESYADICILSIHTQTHMPLGTHAHTEIRGLYCP